MSSIITKKVAIYELGKETVPYSGIYIVPKSNIDLSKAKEILKIEVQRQNYEYEEIIMQAEREANSIKNSKELKKITDLDLETILEKIKLVLTQNGKQALKGILQKEERQERFKDLIFKAFPVESKNICQLRYEVESNLNDKETLNKIRKELNSQIDLLIKK